MKKLVLSLLLLSSSTWALNVSVTSYGAKGDGHHDDTSAIVNASHAVAAAGGYLQFPPGVYMFNPNRGHIEIGSNMEIWGSGTIRVIPDVGVFDYIMGPVPQDAAISNVTVRDITIDENVFNNPGLLGPGESQFENIMTAYGLKHLLVSNATFYLSGMYAFKIKDFLTVQNSKFVFQQRPEQPHFDNSAVYLAADHGTCLITNNSFHGTPTNADQPSQAGQAVEVHYTSNCEISDNTMDGYVTAVLMEDNYSLLIVNNTITRAVVAISLWSQKGLDNVSILKNNISLDTKDRQSTMGAGIMFQYCDYCEPMGNFHNVTIKGNTITYEPDVRSSGMCVSCFWGIGLQTTGDIDTVTISGNTITNAPIRGIQIGSAYTESVVSNVLVEDNILINPGCDSDEPWSAAGISLAGRVKSTTVTANQIKDEMHPFAGNYGLYADRGGKYYNVKVAGNTVQSVYKNQLASGIEQ